MTGPTRRGLLVGGAALWLASASGLAAKGRDGWVEVEGAAIRNGPADRDGARRRALADALLAAAFAGGAEVRGHSVLANTRLTSDLLIVRPVGQILGFEQMSSQCDGQICRIRIRARVGPPAASGCAGRRLVLAAYAPAVHVTTTAPAWADALGQDLALRLVETAANAPAVTGLTRLRGGPATEGEKLYHAATRGPVPFPAGGHLLGLDLRIAPQGRDLALTLAMRLDGPAGEALRQDHSARIRLPGPSLLGAASALVEADRHRMADRLARGAAPALEGFLAKAACRPITAGIRLQGGRLVVAAGRAHGLTPSSLAFTADDLGSTELLEVTGLETSRATLRPLDPSRPAKEFAGRIVRFIDTGQTLP